MRLFSVSPCRFSSLLFSRLLRCTAIGGSGLATLLAVLLCLHIFARPVRAEGVPCTLCISQVYGGGGNSGAPYNADFIELFNPRPDTLALSGWSLAYASKSGEFGQPLALDNLTIAGYGYLLIQLNAGNAGAPLPPPDATGSINLSAQDGKVRLMQGDVEVDLVGYGAADRAEGAPVARLSNTTAAVRLAGGCQDTQRNADDFSPQAPSPHNSQSPANPCGPSAPADTPTPTPPPFDTPTETPTETPAGPPTDTPTFTPEAPVPTDAPTSVATETPSPLTDTPTPADTATPVPPMTDTPTAIPTATPPQVATATETPTLLPVDTATLPPDATPTLTPISTDTPTSAPSVLISEIMVDPAAVADTTGEWIELVNAGADAVNLRGWGLDDGSGPVHPIGADVILPPGAYGVLTRGDITVISPYVSSVYQYAGTVLNNAAGVLTLTTPSNQVQDVVTWGQAGGGAAVTAGASLERTALTIPAVWAVSHGVVVDDPYGSRQPRRTVRSGAHFRDAYRIAHRSANFIARTGGNRHPRRDRRSGRAAAARGHRRGDDQSPGGRRRTRGVGGTLQPQCRGDQPERLDPGRPGQRPAYNPERSLGFRGRLRRAGAQRRPCRQRRRTGCLCVYRPHPGEQRR